MIGLLREPFFGADWVLLPQQVEAMEMIKIHAQHGGFSVIEGNPGVGKSVIAEHLHGLGKERDTVVVSFPRPCTPINPSSCNWRNRCSWMHA